MLFLFNYLKISLWSLVYYYQKEKSDIILSLILKNIKNSGCIGIKLSQWILPRLEALYDIKNNDDNLRWIQKLEELYDNCNEHLIEYTEKKYYDNFSTELSSDYDNISLISSGSIGQVYKIRSKKNQKYYAMKCIHPNINNQLFFFNILIKILYNTPFIKQYIKYYIPVHLPHFIEIFKTQIDFINEANNCLLFYNNYKDNDYIIIPELIKISKDVIIMSYEEGEKYCELNYSEYINQKIWTLMRMFAKNNELILNFVHGDLHKGNWKIRKNKSDIKLVIYDFGFCWKIPDFLFSDDSISFINTTFLKIALNYNDSNIMDNFIESCYLLTNKKCSKEILEKEISNICNTVKLNNPLLLFTLMIRIIRNNDLIIDKYIIQSLILHNQLYENMKKYELNDAKNTLYEYYDEHVSYLIIFCRENKIFDEYINLLEKEKEKYFSENSENSETNSNQINYENLKKFIK